MEPVLTVEEMRAVDSAAQREVPAAVLVERAGTAVAREVLALLAGSAYGHRVAVVAGPGNNGSDGRVAARVLERRGARVQLFDARRPPERIEGADVVVDAAFGTGFRGEYWAPAVEPGVPVVAVDVPTGVDATTGEVRGRAVSAVRTVTFGALKPGLLLGPGRQHCGKVRVEAIGLPISAVTAGIWHVEDGDIAALVPPRRPEDYKWSSALIAVAGSPGMYGAATFVARAALRAGAGMVRLGIPGADPGQLPVSEAVARVLEEVGFESDVLGELGRFEALVVGPGIGRRDGALESIRRLVAGSGALPTLVDADGLAALGSAEEAASLIASRRSPGGWVAYDPSPASPVVLTPHAGEFARLAGEPPGSDRVASARDLARRSGAVVLVKGSTTVVAEPGGRVAISTAGSSVLATAGTGDVLSGVVGALLARAVPPLEAAALGAHLHGRAASLGYEEGLVAGDLPDLVARVLSLSARRRFPPQRFARGAFSG
ncbi:MAG: NAD(P)H-hydrate dehydratase [Actinomycetota bacterium]|nr:NAD(P)H-hydrate dehydratase [Actinomycetota bacterium]